MQCYTDCARTIERLYNDKGIYTNDCPEPRYLLHIKCDSAEKLCCYIKRFKFKLLALFNQKQKEREASAE